MNKPHKIWIDILTPKQVNFFSGLIVKLERAGINPILTTRRYREVNELLDLRGIEAKNVGEHGGGTLENKLIASTSRIQGLTEIFLKEKPDIAISFSSPEAARTSFGLGIPHYCVSDSPHSEAVSKLTVPISEKLFTPKIIPSKIWTRYGIRPNRIVRYNAIDPAAWLKGFKPNPKVLEELELKEDTPIVLLRTIEEQASYIHGMSGHIKTMIGVAEKICERFRNSQVILLPRYDVNIKSQMGSRDLRVKVPECAVDGTSLLYYSTLFIGAGGTMTAESALLGVPTISCYPAEPTYVDKFLMGKGLVRRLLGSEAIVREASRTLQNPDALRRSLQKKASALLREMENPIDVIYREIVG